MPRSLRIPCLLLVLFGAAAAGWWPEERLTERPDSTDRTSSNNCRAIAADPSGNLHAVWYGEQADEFQVWYSRWDAGTGQWSADTVITGEPDGACLPAVAADDTGNVHVLWQVGPTTDGRGLHYRRRDGSTGAWGQVETVATGTHAQRPSIAARNPDFAVAAWEQQYPANDRNVFASWRAASGWSASESLGVTAPHNHTMASVGVDTAHDIGVMWILSGAGSEERVLFRWRSDTGWGAVETLQTVYEATAPCVHVAAGGTAHAVWRLTRSAGGDYVVYAQRRDGVWFDTVSLPRVSRQPQPASVSADEFDGIHVVFCDGNPKQVYYTASEDSGLVWSEPFVLTSASGDRENPSICAGPGGNLQVVWTDYRHSTQNPDVYCRRYVLDHDVAVVCIEQPGPMVDSGTVVTPAARIANYGRSPEANVPVWFRLDDTTWNTVIPLLEPCEVLRLEFPPWPAEFPGWHTVLCSTSVAGDERPNNDFVSDSFFVCVRDVAVESIVEPVGVQPLDTVWPKAVVANRGNLEAEVTALFRVCAESLTVFSDTLAVTLGPGSDSVFAFEPWPGNPGTYEARCSSFTSGDMHPENDTAAALFKLYWADVGVGRIVWPADTVDSGVVDVPLVAVENLGSDPATFQVFLSIGGLYAENLAVDSLAPGRDTTISFPEWCAEPGGWHPVRCSLYLAGDMDPQNDVLWDSAFVCVRDVAIESIIEPRGCVPRGTIRPRAKARNRGNVFASCTCRFWIESDSVVYDSTRAVELEPGGDSVVEFAPCSLECGSYMAACAVSYPGDMHPENDTASVLFELYWRDVGIDSIVWPADTVDFGVVDVPLVAVENLGSDPATFQAFAFIDTLYAESLLVDSVFPGCDTNVGFPEWCAEPRGWLLVRCSLCFSGDMDSTNDVRLDSVFVRVNDAGVTAILKPEELIGRGEVRPEAMVGNFGNDTARVSCLFVIRQDTALVYEDSVWEVELGPGSDTAVVFGPWQAGSGSYSAWCWTVLEGDMVSGNDTASIQFRVIVVDGAATAVLSPVGRIGPGSVVPRLGIANLGEEAVDMTAVLQVSDTGVAYVDSVLVAGVPAGAETTAVFEQWDAQPGSYAVLAWVEVDWDRNPENDTVSAGVVVESMPSTCWTELASVPTGPRSRQVKAGGSLVATGNGIMALKGGNTDEWYWYDAGADSWSELAPMPAGSSLKKVRGGAALCWDQVSTVYALKGNRTHEFWEYDVMVDFWSGLPSLPAGTRPVKYGSGLVFVPGDTGKVFLVKGSGTLDFLVYWVGPAQWHARRPLPPGPSGRKARHGTCLVSLGERVFCLKGRTNELYEYLVEQDTWLERAMLPRQSRTGRARRCGRGAALAGDGSRCVYAFKGGGCDEFWQYDAVADTWAELEPIPRGSRRRRVKAGGALAWFDARLYALKGRCLEFWSYESEQGLCLRPTRTGIAGASTGLTDPGQVHVRVGPGTRVRVCAGPYALSRVRVHDTSGRLVRVRQSRHGDVLTLSGFPSPGVYFLTFGQQSRAVRLTIIR